MSAPIYFGKLMPEREKMLEKATVFMRPHLGDLEVGQSLGMRWVMTREGLRIILEPKKIEVLL